MSKRDELLTSCRYYKGEKESPYEGKDQNKNMLWFYESCWVQDLIRTSDLSYLLDEYLGVGLGNFSEHDGVPVTLKALLFNRYAKWSYSMMDAVEPFKEFYRKYYGAQGGVV